MLCWFLEVGFGTDKIFFLPLLWWLKLICVETSSSFFRECNGLIELKCSQRTFSVCKSLDRRCSVFFPRVSLDFSSWIKESSRLIVESFLALEGILLAANLGVGPD